MRISRDETLFSSQESTHALLKGLGHEIKIRLGGFAWRTLEHELEDPELKEYTQIIIDEADRLRKLVDRMLGPLPHDTALTNIHEVLERVRYLTEADCGDSIIIYVTTTPAFLILKLIKSA